MATNRWLGHAAETAQVTTLTVGSSTNGHTFITTINGKAITYTAGSGETTSTIATAVQALLAASEIPEFAEVTWTVATNVVTGTAANPGVPFTVSLSGTGTYSASTTTANSGPNVAGVAANWSLAALPGAGAEFLLDCLDRNLTVAAAQTAWTNKLAADNAALAEQVGALKTDLEKAQTVDRRDLTVGAAPEGAGDPWDRDADLRAEFGGEKSRYDAFRRATAAGRVRGLRAV